MDKVQQIDQTAADKTGTPIGGARDSGMQAASAVRVAVVKRAHNMDMKRRSAAEIALKAKHKANKKK